MRKKISKAKAVAEGGMTRRQAIGVMLAAGVLPAFIGKTPAWSAATDPGASSEFSDSLRRLSKSDLTFEEIGRITGTRHRVIFSRARWTDAGGNVFETIVRDVELASGPAWTTGTSPDHRFDEQWVVIEGTTERLLAGNYYGNGTPHWIGFHSFRQISGTVAELAGSVAGVLDLTVRWDVGRDNPEVSFQLDAQRAGTFVTGYQAVDTIADDQVVEVMCGATQHSRIVGPPTGLGAWEMFVPMTLAQTVTGGAALTAGVYIPSEVLEFEHERFLGPSEQPFAMSLRSDDWQIQPVAYAPQGGERAELAAGGSIAYAFGLAFSRQPLYETFTEIARAEYGFGRYRKNLYGTSMTDTVHNIIDLVAIEPDGEDAETFVPSFSGWWDRGKGFENIEAVNQVRLASVTGIAEAALLAASPAAAAQLWDRRARPVMEYTLSRRDIGHSPVPGEVGGSALAGWVGDEATLSTVHLANRAQSSGIRRVILDAIGSTQVGRDRSPMSRAIGAYQATEDPAWLAEATAIATRYLEREIEAGYSTPASSPQERSFGFNLVKRWSELVVLYELTGETRFLDAAYTEAKRYAGLFSIRPVPSGRIDVPVGAPIDDQYYKWPGTTGLPDYPRTTPVAENVENWEVSTTGLTFEQLSTYKIWPGGGFTLNAMWAPTLARLAAHKNDDFLRDLAHNSVVGRFTNYPGYYNRQFISAPTRPDFPLEGPPGTSAIYYHHAPAQLALAIDWLLSQHEIRSGGRVKFPSAFETVFVYFRYRTYGHAPGEFFGDTGVWPYFPRGIVSVSDHQLDWVTAVSDHAFYVSLANADAEEHVAHITFDPELTGIQPNTNYRATLFNADGSSHTRTFRNKLSVPVPAHGLRGVKIEGVGVLASWHRVPEGPESSITSYHFDDFDGGGNTTTDRVKGIILPRPDGEGYDAYVQCSAVATSVATLKYWIADGPEQIAPAKPFPWEWTIPVADRGASFRYQVTVDNTVRPQRTLQLPPQVAGGLPAGVEIGGELIPSQSTLVAPDSFVMRARIVNGPGGERTNAAVTLTVPSGWSTSPQRIELGTLAADSVTTVEFAVTSAVDTATGGRGFTSRLSWDGGAINLAATQVEVVPPVVLAEATASPTRLPGPGGSTTVTAVIMNRGSVPRSGTLSIAVPAGWTVDSNNVAWTVDPRALKEVVVTATAATAAPGSSGTIALDSGVAFRGTKSFAVTVENPDDIILQPTDTGTAEIGSWLASSLAGYNGVATRYSPEFLYGGQVVWTPNLVREGRYRVSVWYPTNADTTTAALYTVQATDGAHSFTLDQTVGADQWTELGEFRLAPGTSSATLTVVSGKFTRYSACRFTYLGT